MNKIKRNKRFIMLYSHYTIYFFELFQVEGETDRSSAETTSSKLSSDDLATELKRLEISSRGRDDETFLSPDTGSLVSSTSDEAPTTMQEPRKKLNEYLVSKSIPPVTQPWMEWDKAGESTKKRYTQRTLEIFSSVLQDLTPNYAGSLWQAVVSSPAMNKALKLDELSQTSKIYLQALAEAYGKARGWQTRRQILSMVSSVASFNDISRFIPGLTRYRYSLANLHRLQYGSGAPTTHHPSPKIKVLASLTRWSRWCATFPVLRIPNQFADCILLLKAKRYTTAKGPSR